MKKLISSIIFLLTGFNLLAQPQINLNLFATGLSNPVDIKHCGDNRLFIVEKNGYIQILDSTGSINANPFLDIDNEVGSSGSEQGLLGLAFSPNYATDGLFYVNYTDNNGNTTISRISVNSSNPDLADASSEEIILYVPQPYSNHNGGHLQFGADGYLYIGLGDGGNGGDPGNRAQNKKEFLGKMLRLDVSSAPGYTIPSSNPFVGDSTYYPEIWALGLRNPWRYCFDKLNGDLWIGEVGQSAWEEIDYHKFGDLPGQNFGWRCYEGNVAYNTSGCGIVSTYAAPVSTYQHSSTNGCSITGGYVYRGAQYAELFGKYLNTDFCTGNIWATEQTTPGNFSTTLLGNFTDNQYGTWGEDNYGELYIAELYSGKIYKLGETSCLPTAFISENDSIVICANSYTLQTPAGVGLTYQWKRNGVSISGATLSSFTVTQSGNYTVRVTNSSSCNNLSEPFKVVLNNLPIANITNLSGIHCVNVTSVSLTGTPAGGTFTGPGVSGNIFNPSAAGIGSHKIKYHYTNSAGCSDNDTKTVLVDGCALVSEYGYYQEIKIVPNPNNGIFELELPANQIEDAYITISNMLGEEILEKEIQPIQGRKLKFTLENISPGIYFLKIYQAGKQAINKFVVK